MSKMQQDTQEYIKAFYEKAMTFYILTRFREADEMLQKFMSMKSVDEKLIANAYFVRSLIQQNFKEYLQAFDIPNLLTYQKLIQFDSNNPLGYKGCGSICFYL